jgi:hypothetical protein
MDEQEQFDDLAWRNKVHAVDAALHALREVPAAKDKKKAPMTAKSSTRRLRAPVPRLGQQSSPSPSQS